MKVLVIGSGSQEHAIAWKLSQSRLVTRIYCCPGNPGIAQIAECIDIQPNDLNALVDFVKYEWIDFTVITDTSLLLQGMADLFGREGCRVSGPNLAASRLGSSRAVAKNLIRLTGVPTPEFRVFSSFLHAQEHVRLTLHRPQAPHLEHEPLDGLGTPLCIRRHQPAGLLGQVDQDRP